MVRINYRFKGNARLALVISFVICLVVLVIRYFYGLSVEDASGMSGFIGYLAIIWVALSVVIYIVLQLKDIISGKK